MEFPRRQFHLFLAGLLFFSAFFTFPAIATSPSTQPASEKPLFDGEDLSPGPAAKNVLATSIGTYVRNHLNLSDEANVEKAKKFLAVALLLESHNKTSYVASLELKQQRIPSKVTGPDVDEAAIAKQMLAMAEKTKASSVGDDRQFAAYLYSLVLEISPENDDAIFELGVLSESGVRVAWKTADVDKVEKKDSSKTALTQSIESELPTAKTDLVLALSFDDDTRVEEHGQTYFRDSSGRNNRALMHGAAVVDGKVGQAVLFAGNDQYLELENNNDLDAGRDFTVSAWIKLSREGVTGTFVDKADWVAQSKVRGYTLRIVNGVVDFNVGSREGWTSARTGFTFPKGVWTQVAGTFDGKDLKIYVDGKLIEAKPLTSPIEASAYPLRIGNGTFEGARDRGCPGAIDEVAIFRRALSESEMASLYKITKARSDTKRAGTTPANPG